jgi:Cys-tRNA synthase (O-phospho-L-seryl-tRNA:Cys-tRNA synthase)
LVKCFGLEKQNPEDSVNSEAMSALQIQSRNNILGANSDMYGVYSFLTLRKTVIDAFFERIVAFRKPKEKVIIACEFAGSNIQRNIALNKTSKFLVIYGVKVDSEWLAQDDWATLMLESQADRIYNVRDERLPSYKIVLDMNDVTSTQNQLATVVDEIDRNCPFGANIFGVQGMFE